VVDFQEKNFDNFFWGNWGRLGTQFFVKNFFFSTKNWQILGIFKIKIVKNKNYKK